MNVNEVHLFLFKGEKKILGKNQQNKNISLYGNDDSQKFEAKKK